jgi:hypothetical protein
MHVAIQAAVSLRAFDIISGIVMVSSDGASPAVPIFDGLSRWVRHASCRPSFSWEWRQEPRRRLPGCSLRMGKTMPGVRFILRASG